MISLRLQEERRKKNDYTHIFTVEYRCSRKRTTLSLELTKLSRSDFISSKSKQKIRDRLSEDLMKVYNFATYHEVQMLPYEKRLISKFLYFLIGYNVGDDIYLVGKYVGPRPYSSYEDIKGLPP